MIHHYLRYDNILQTIQSPIRYVYALKPSLKLYCDIYSKGMKVKDFQPKNECS